MNKYVLIVAALGLISGLGIASLVQSPESSYCKSMEQKLVKNQNFTGSLSCYPPGVIDVNLSDKVENNTRLRCVCRNRINEKVHLFPITQAEE